MRKGSSGKSETEQVEEEVAAALDCSVEELRNAVGEGEDKLQNEVGADDDLEIDVDEIIEGLNGE